MAHFIESVGKIEMIKNIIFDVGKVLVEVRWQEVMRELGFDEATVELVSNATVCSSTWGEYDRSKLPVFEIFDEKGESIYKSKKIAPGYEMNCIELDKELSKGRHECTIEIQYAVEGYVATMFPVVIEVL